MGMQRDQLPNLRELIKEAIYEGIYKNVLAILIK
jgi:hypothetical protein